MKLMADSMPENQMSQIRAELFAGRKIQAIKIYREATGEGLKQAKDAVEALEAEMRVQSPEQFEAPTKRGCLTMVVLLVIPAVVAACI